MSVRITVDVMDPDPPPGPDAELRAAAEALVLGGADHVGDTFVRNLVHVGAPAYWRLADALGIDPATLDARRVGR